MESIGMSWGVLWCPKDVLGSAWDALGTSLWVSGDPQESLEVLWWALEIIKKPLVFLVFPRTGAPMCISWALWGNTLEAFGDSSVFPGRPCALRGPFG